MKIAVLLCGLLLPLVVESQSMTIIGGDSFAKDCYQSAGKAAIYSQASNSDLDSCDLAIQQANLTTRDLSATYLNRGVVYAALEKYQNAQADYERAQRLMSDSPEVYLNMGNLHFLMHEFTQAIELYNRAEELHLSQSHVLFVNRGMAFLHLGKDKEAEFEYRQALEFQPNWEVALQQLEVLSRWRADGQSQ